MKIEICKREEIPVPAKRPNQHLPLIQEFLASGAEAARVMDFRSADAAVTSLKAQAKRCGFPCTAIARRGSVYLLRTDGDAK